jgi:hypothetical protein
MKNDSIGDIVDSALLNGIVEAECEKCGMSIQCETDAKTAWCGLCEKRVTVKNPLKELGFI